MAPNVGSEVPECCTAARLADLLKGVEAAIVIRRGRQARQRGACADLVREERIPQWLARGDRAARLRPSRYLFADRHSDVALKSALIGTAQTTLGLIELKEHDKQMSDDKPAVTGSSENDPQAHQPIETPMTESARNRKWIGVECSGCAN